VVRIVSTATLGQVIRDPECQFNGFSVGDRAAAVEVLIEVSGPGLVDKDASPNARSETAVVADGAVRQRNDRTDDSARLPLGERKSIVVLGSLERGAVLAINAPVSVLVFALLETKFVLEVQPEIGAGFVRDDLLEVGLLARRVRMIVMPAEFG